jgi:hypothetical protein
MELATRAHRENGLEAELASRTGSKAGISPFAMFPLFITKFEDLQKEVPALACHCKLIDG